MGECKYYYVQDKDHFLTEAYKLLAEAHGTLRVKPESVADALQSLTKDQLNKLFGICKIYVDNTIEGLRSQLMTSLKGESFNASFSRNGGFHFYHADSVEEIKQAFQEAHDAYSKTQSVPRIAVTTIAGQIFDANRMRDETSDRGRGAVLDMKFRKEFGTLVHKAFQFDEKTVASKEFTEEFINLFARYAGSIDNNMLVAAEGQVRQTLDYIIACNNAIKDRNLKVIDNAINNIVTIKQQLYKKYGTTCFVEWDVLSKSKDRPAAVSGSIDLAFVTPDKKVIIIDFKTTPNNTISEKSKGYHWLQLQLYKNILQDYGIRPEDIQYRNVILQYSAAENNGVPGQLVLSEEVNPDSDGYVGGSIRNQGASHIRIYFPTTVNIGPEAGERITKIESQANKLVGQIKLKRYEEESIKANVESLCKNNGESYSAQVGKVVKFEGSNGIIKLYDYKDGSFIKEINIDDYVRKEVEAYKKNWTDSFNALRPLIVNRQFESVRAYIERNQTYANALWANLYPYMSEDYEYIQIPELEQFNIICMKHVSGIYDFIKLVPTTGAFEYSPNPDAHILDSIITDPTLLRKYRETTDTLRPTLGSLSLLEASLAISQFADRIPNFKLGSINCISTVNGSIYKGLDHIGRLEMTFRLLSTFAETNPEIEGIGEFKDTYKLFHDIPKEDVEGTISRSIVSACRAASVDQVIPELNFSDKWRKTENIQAKLEEVTKLREWLKKELGNKHFSQNTEAKSKITDAIDYCDKLLGMLQNTLEHKIGSTEMHEMSSYGIDFNTTIVAGYNLLAKGTVSQWTKSGMQITALAQALESSVSYASPDQMNRRFVHFYDAATAKIRTEIQKEAVEINTATEKFIAWGKQNGLISSLDPISGNHEKLYRSVLQKNNGNVSKVMRFINPYSGNELTPEQKEFVEIALWTLNRHRMKDLSIKARHISYSDFKHSDEFQGYVNALTSDARWLNLPLRKKDGSQGTWSGFKAVLSHNKTVKEFVNGEIDRMRRWIEPEVLNEAQREERKRAISNLDYFNYYKLNESRRAEATEENEVDAWEINMNRLLIDYALADVREYYFDGLLHQADRTLGEIKVLELTTGKNFSKQAEQLMNRIQVSIYGKSLVNEDWEDIMAGMGVIKQIMSIAKISVRPMLFVKEMILGRIRNTSVILAQLVQNGENKITMTHLREAAGVVFGPEFFGKASKKLFGQLSIGAKSMADVLNDVYGINDRDLSVIGEKVAYDDYGLYNWGSRMLYLNTIAPDWFNRMILFIAKMKADGTWDAHKLVDGYLAYDMSKDERIAEFWNNKSHPKNTPEYKKAEAFYKLRMQQFEAEGWKNPDGSSLRYGQLDPKTNQPVYDAFPRCYTSAEEDSIKEQIGMVYGYYSHDERATMQKGMWWTMYTQFLTFMPAEVRKYLANGTESSIINTVHEKDPITGEALYWEEVDDPTNLEGPKLHIKTTNQYNNKHEINEPVLKDVYSAYEGLLVSTAKIVGQLCRGDFASIKENPQRIRNAELFLFNTLFAALIAAIVAYLSGLGAKSTSLDITADLLKKTGNELDFYHTVLQPIGGFGLVGTDFLQGTFSNVFKTISSENYSLYDLSKDTMSIVKDAHLNLDFD